MIQQVYKFDPAAIVAKTIEVPEYIKGLASCLSTDLYYGHSYYVPGESLPGEASCFDDGSKPFDSPGH